MFDKCYNRCTAIGTKEQIHNLQSKLNEVFGKNFVINNNTSNEKGSCLVFTVESFKIMPEQDLKMLTIRLHDIKQLYIKVESQNIAALYFANAIFSYGLWSFEPMPNINAKIIELKKQGIEYIKKRVEEHGNIDFGEDCNYSAIYVNDDGYAECPYYQRIELEDDGQIAILLTDGIWLYENELTPNHIMDLLNQLEEIDTKSTELI